MLAFDYSPASFFNSDCLFRPERQDIYYSRPQHPLRHAFYQHPQQSRRMMRSRSCQPRRVNHQQQYFTNLLNQLVEESQQRKPEVTSKVFNTKDSYQIQILKDDDDFKHFSIRYKISGSEALIHVESEIDDFSKTFKFNQNSIDIENVEWRIVRNVLVINVPKCKDEFILRPAVKISKPKQQIEKTPSSSSSETTPEPTKSSELDSKPKIISIPIEFQDSEAEIETRGASNSRRSSITESIKSNTRTESEAELNSDEDEQEPSHKLPKLTRRVSIEEVEDESLHQMDLD